MQVYHNCKIYVSHQVLCSLKLLPKSKLKMKGHFFEIIDEIRMKTSEPDLAFVVFLKNL